MGLSGLSVVNSLTGPSKTVSLVLQYCFSLLLTRRETVLEDKRNSRGGANEAVNNRNNCAGGAKALVNNKGGGPRVVVSTAAFHARVWGPVPGLGGLKETKIFLPHPRVKVSIVGSLRDREVACSASDCQGSNFESCVWRTVTSQSSHHPQEVLLAQFSLYVHKGGLKPDSFHFILLTTKTTVLEGPERLLTTTL